ncbi:MAG: hypothetical protein L0228_11610 [Planctomycetes bacterium]|nr:hypothetical protein [Planctomycetota bacterium]
MNQRNYGELLDALAELRRCYPEWRLGQLITNVAGWADQNVWDVDDDHLLAAIEEHLQALAQRRQEART